MFVLVLERLFGGGGHRIGRKMNTLRGRESRYNKAICVELGLETQVCNLSPQESGSAEL